MNILFIADLMGNPGRAIVRQELPSIVAMYGIDIVIANGENSAGGFGITPKVAEEMFASGIDIITLGNHAWDKKEVTQVIVDSRVIRPANYPSDEIGGKGFVIARTKSGKEIGIVNLLGRVFLSTVDCPFRAATRVVEEIRKRTNVILVDIHAEATSEKVAMGWYLDGKVSAVVGTHTHVATADEKILPEGTAYITDVGLTGSHDSVIGVKKEMILKRFLLQVPIKYDVADKRCVLEGAVITVDDTTGKARSIHRVQRGDVYANERNDY